MTQLQSALDLLLSLLLPLRQLSTATATATTVHSLPLLLLQLSILIATTVGTTVHSHCHCCCDTKPNSCKYAIIIKSANAASAQDIKSSAQVISSWFNNTLSTLQTLALISYQWHYEILVLIDNPWSKFNTSIHIVTNPGHQTQLHTLLNHTNACNIWPRIMKTS